MPLETYTGRDVSELLAAARARLGDDAVVLETRRKGRGFELVAADAASALGLVADAAPASVTAPPEHPELAAGSVRRIAIVGPTGAGKTTTIAKLLRHPDGTGERTGVLGLDTHRIGAIATLHALARSVKARVAVAYEPGDLLKALRALRGCRTLLIDTAGRGPARADDMRATWDMLRALRPAEIHLAAPAGLHPDRVRRLLLDYRPLGITHLLITKLDEHRAETLWFELAAQFRIAMRWVTHGQDLMHDLSRASTWRVGRGPASVLETAAPSLQEQSS